MCDHCDTAYLRHPRGNLCTHGLLRECRRINRTWGLPLAGVPLQRKPTPKGTPYASKTHMQERCTKHAASASMTIVWQPELVHNCHRHWFRTFVAPSNWWHMGLYIRGPAWDTGSMRLWPTRAFRQAHRSGPRIRLRLKSKLPLLIRKRS